MTDLLHNTAGCVPCTDQLFTKPIQRRGTNSYKWDSAPSDDVIPLWVADMDFRTAPEILEAMARRVEHGIFGYTEPQEPYFNAVTRWHAERYGWEPQREWTVVTPGVVFALAMVVKAFSQPGDCVLIQQPVYYPFKEVVEDNGRYTLY